MAGSDGLDASTADAVDRFLDDTRAKTDLPALSVAVVAEGGQQYATGLGAADVEDGRAATPDTRYWAGSITKVCTAIAVLQLCERDDLALDDAVAESVDHLRDVPGEPITVRELLTHTSGMPSDAVALRDTIASPRDLELHVAGAAERRVTEDPPLMYYNSGYKVLGEVIAAVDGREYATYVHEEVLDPLGMERSTFDPDACGDDDVMTGYALEDGDRSVHDEPLHFESGPADGGLLAPVTDLGRLARWYLGEGAVDGGRLLPPETVDEMTTPAGTMFETVDGTAMEYGYGTMLSELCGEQLVGHGGTVAHAQAWIWANPERGTGVAVAGNATGAPMAAIASGVLAILEGKDPREAVPELALREKLEAVAGTYEGYRDGASATVAAAEGRLQVTLEPYGWEFPAFPETTDREDRRFYTVEDGGRRQRLTFRATDEGMDLLFARTRLSRSGG